MPVGVLTDPDGDARIANGVASGRDFNYIIHFLPGGVGLGWDGDGMGWGGGGMGWGGVGWGWGGDGMGWGGVGWGWGGVAHLRDFLSGLLGLLHLLQDERCTRANLRDFLSGLLGLLHLLRYERCARAHLRDFFFLVYLVYLTYFRMSAARDSLDMGPGDQRLRSAQSSSP